MRWMVLSLALVATPVAAEEGGDVAEGLDLLSQGTRLLIEGLIAELGPALEEMQGVLDNLDAYHPPEVLENGDILIRRKRADDPAPAPDEGGEVEL